MARTRDPALEARDNAIIEAYALDKNVNLTHLGERFGITYTNVYRILVQAGVYQRTERSVVRRPKKPFHEQRPVTPLHYRIGNACSWWRDHQAEPVTKAALAALMRISVVRLTQIEVGIAADLTLVEIQKIVECTGISLETLMGDPEKLLGSLRLTGRPAASTGYTP